MYKRIRILIKSLREFTKDAIMTPIYVVGEVIMEALIPYTIALLINEVKNGAGVSRIVHYSWILLGMSMLSLLFGYLGGAASAKASSGYARNLRHDVFTRIQSFSFGNIDHFSNASLVTRLTTDIQNIQMAFMLLIRMAFRAPVSLVISFIMAFIMGGRIALVFLVVIPILGLGLFFLARQALKYFTIGFPKYDQLNNSAEENIKGIRVVKAYVREEYETANFKENSAQICRIFTKAEKILAFNSPLMQMCIYGVMLFVLSFGSYEIITTHGVALDIGQFSTLLTYSFQILVSLMMLSMLFVMLTFAQESSQRVCEVLTEVATIVNPRNPLTEVKDGSVDFDQVTFKYTKEALKPVLEDIDLHIRSGETIGIIGGTGAAKSSLVQLIPRLYDVNEGTVRVGKEDVRNYDLEVLRDAVAMVLQKNLLFSGTIADNIRWGNQNASMEEIRHVCHLACADEFIDQMPDGYETKIEQGGTNVSGGQKQRLCIARALLKKPKILILDDSTSAVDTKTDALIRKAMREYIPSTTKIIIAQRTSSVEDADRIVVLDNGKIEAVGTHEELLQKSMIYREVYLSQNKQGHEEEDLPKEVQK